ncbi:MAG TPA: cytochrome c oxidase assembly protein [Burkholderiales bacterium]|jgi:cytochrome c oxidase assembly factor CtaG|nr:cytochrome c oxidase assembly protein [Burkholderiales bacterium]
MHELTIALLLLAAGAYAAGLRRLWARAGMGRGIAFSKAALFYSGCAVAGVAVLGLHELAEERLWAHMIQHELLMVVAAPMIVLGRPIETWIWALPADSRRAARLPRALSDPALAWVLHAAAIWVWHLPVLFEAALADPWLHLAQHASFFGTALLFWWSLLAPSHRSFAGMASLFTTMLHTGALGALMALARGSWYAGFSLEDQQLAGLVMWVPAGLAYPLAALFLGSQWLRRSAA